jgi:hypothetical protein
LQNIFKALGEKKTKRDHYMRYDANATLEIENQWRHIIAHEMKPRKVIKKGNNFQSKKTQRSMCQMKITDISDE